MVLPRFVTALVMLPLVVLSIWWGGIPFFILIFGVSLLALYEFLELSDEADMPVFKIPGLLLGAALSVSIFLFGTRMGWNKSMAAEIFFTPAVLTALVLMLCVAALFPRWRAQGFSRISGTLTAIFYVVWGLSHLYLIRDLRPNGQGWTFFLFITIWALDTFAWAGGIRFGRTPLCEVSPKKTWEGSAIGTFAACVAVLILRPFLLPEVSAGTALLLGLFVAVLAQVSDLSESLFKRNADVKDSGGLLPGHGGLLDRFDSFVLTAPAFYYLLVYTGHA